MTCRQCGDPIVRRLNPHRQYCSMRCRTQRNHGLVSPETAAAKKLQARLQLEMGDPVPETVEA